MHSMDETGVVASPASGRTSPTPRLPGLAATGFIATLAAMVATTASRAAHDEPTSENAGPPESGEPAIPEVNGGGGGI